jgi:Trk-type K+ transport system membrane component
LRKKKKSFSLANYTHLGLTSRLVIQVTLILIITSFVIYLLLEENNSLLTENWLSKIVTSFFMIVTPRTAGFSVVDLTQLKMATLVLIILLMWIGASPVSTGGGIKTTTVAIAFKTAFAFGLKQKDVYMFNRKISLLSIRKALVVIFFSFFLIFMAAFLLSIFDGDKPFLYLLFECFSAYGTVGLSCNLTPQLSESSKLVLIFLMFIGRVGFITFLSVFFRYRRENLYELPEEEILI